MAMDNVIKFGKTPKKGGRISEWLNYFKTTRGRNFSQLVLRAASVIVPGAFAAYQTFFIDYYLDFVRAYRNGLPLDVPEELELLVDKASDRINLAVREATYLKTFMVSGFDIKSVGTMNSMFGGWIGFPVNYLYKTTMDIDRSDIKIRTQPIKWDSKYGEMLQNSLVLTEEEKLFAISRTILELRNYNHYHNTFVPAAVIQGLYISAQTINKRYNLFLVPRTGRMLVYGVLTFFAYGIYSFVTDTITIAQISRIDKALVALGADVIEAGISFYDKLLHKNVAIRELSGQDWYSVKGNEYPGWLRYNVFPLTTRKLYLEQMLKDIREKEAAEKKSNETIDTEISAETDAASK